MVDEYSIPLTLYHQECRREKDCPASAVPILQRALYQKTTSHPCIDGTDSIIDCDMFCAGFSPEVSDYGNDRMLDLTQQSLCQTNHRDELTSCGIRTITLHHQHRSDRYIPVSIELSVGCSDEQQRTVMQHHAGLAISQVVEEYAPSPPTARFFRTNTQLQKTGLFLTELFLRSPGVHSMADVHPRSPSSPRHLYQSADRSSPFDSAIFRA